MATKAVLSEAEVGILVKDIYGKVYKINCNLTVHVGTIMKDFLRTSFRATVTKTVRFRWSLSESY